MEKFKHPSISLSILFFIQLFFSINLYALQPPALSSVISEQKITSIDISELLPFYETLPPDEKEEQIRDWTVYGLLAKLNLSEKSVRELLQGTMPMRYQYLKNSVDNEISPGRIKYITDKDCIMILSEDRLNDKSLIGSILDKKYSHNNYCPELVHLFGYRVDFNSGVITVSYNRTIQATTIFSKEYNYFEKEVRNVEDFKCFISNIDDITLVKWKEKSIVFGGRKYEVAPLAPEESMRALSLEDIAILYKAYNVVITPEKEKKHRDDYNNFINQKYVEVLRQNRQLKKAVERGQVKRLQIIEKICGQIPYMQLNEEKKLHTLDFLHQVQTTQPYDFEAWYKNTDYLKIKTTVPFLDKKIYNRRTECLSLLSSRNYSLMGQSLFLSGGVSLASKKDILQKLKRKTISPVAKKIAVSPAGMKNITAKTTKVQEPVRVEQTSRPEPEKRVEIITEQKELKLNCRVNNMDYGNLCVEKKEAVVKLKWNKNTGVLLNELLDNLVKIQETKQLGYKDERIFGLLREIEGAIRVEEGRIYFLKIKDMKTEWIYLSINEQDMASVDYPAKAAGTEPDSDIFYGKVITNEQVSKILEKKNTVKIL
ncbi:MAG: hypothetical protein ABH886_08860 [Candidatus Desantisbacteria bacterium]